MVDRTKEPSLWLKELEFREAFESKDYRGVLRLFNEKGIAASIGSMLGVDKREYQGKVINLLDGKRHDRIVEAIEVYLPDGIPRKIS